MAPQAWTTATRSSGTRTLTADEAKLRGRDSTKCRCMNATAKDIRPIAGYRAPRFQRALQATGRQRLDEAHPATVASSFANYVEIKLGNPLGTAYGKRRS